jgi:hypothetical protein
LKEKLPVHFQKAESFEKNDFTSLHEKIKADELKTRKIFIKKAKIYLKTETPLKNPLLTTTLMRSETKKKG